MAENADTPDAEVLRKLAAFLAKLPRESHLFWYRGGEWVKDREAQEALNDLRDAYTATRPPDA